MTPASKTEKAHRVLSQFLRPKLRPGADIEFTPLFVGVNDQNITDRLDDIVGGAVRLTCGDLTCNVAVPELKRKLKQAVEEDGTRKETSNGIDQSVIDRVLLLLENRLTHEEMLAVKNILMQPSKKQRAASNDPEQIGEDAKNAKIAYDTRWPNAAKVRIEPTMTPEPMRQVTPDVAAYFERFPNARRIGQ